MRKSVVSDPEIITDILDKAEVLTLALHDEEGPYSVPVNFVEKDGVIYIHSGRKGRKAAALDTGKTLAFSAVVDVKPKIGKDACSYGYKFRSVLGEGSPRLLEGEESRKGLDLITLKYAGELLPYNEKHLPITAVYAIDIESATARIKE